MKRYLFTNVLRFMCYLHHYYVACERDNRCTACALYTLRFCVNKTVSDLRQSSRGHSVVDSSGSLSQSLA